MPLTYRQTLIVTVVALIIFAAALLGSRDRAPESEPRGVAIEDVQPQPSPRTGSAFLEPDNIQRFVIPEPQRSTDPQPLFPSPEDTPKYLEGESLPLPAGETEEKSLLAPSSPPRHSLSPSAISPSSSQPSNPNFENIDVFLGAIAKAERAQGLSEAEISEHARVILAYAATSTNFREEFEKSFSNGLALSPLDESLFGRFASATRSLLRPLADALIPSASAVTGVPFGGPILFVYPCSCPPGIVALTVGPPSTASVLNYTVGTQAFLNYNLPAARFLLGLYTPGVQSCWQYALLGCFTIPAAGHIQPTVGSSL